MIINADIYTSTPMTKKPTIPTSTTFKDLHERIERHFSSVAELAEDLQEMKSTELWKVGGYSSWADYCDRGLGRSIRRIQQILRTNRIIKNVLAEIEEKPASSIHRSEDDKGHFAKESEGGTRRTFAPTDTHIVALERDEWLRESVAKLPPEKRVPAIESVAEKGEPLTAKNVAKAAEDISPKSKREIGKPIYAMSVWKELTDAIGRAINREGAVNELLCIPEDHEYIRTCLNNAFNRAESRHEKARK